MEIDPSKALSVYGYNHGCEYEFGFHYENGYAHSYRCRYGCACEYRYDYGSATCLMRVRFSCGSPGTE